jgi:hypothetical protein
MDEKSGCKFDPEKPATIAALFGSTGAEAILVFQAAVDGNGTNPLRLPTSPRLMPLHVGPPVDTVTVIGTE